MYIPKPTTITYVYTKAYYNLLMYIPKLTINYLCIYTKPTIIAYVYTKAYYNYLCIYQSLLYLLMYIPKLTLITYVYTKAYYN